MSSEIADASVGGVVIATSSVDGRFPPSNINDGNVKTFYSTTGSMPQEIIIQFKDMNVLKSIDLVSTGINEVQVFTSAAAQPTSWDLMNTSGASDGEEDLQRLFFKAPANTSALFLKLRILSGFKPFVTLHKISVMGSVDSGKSTRK